jgi:hypothetical protein
MQAGHRVIVDDSDSDWYDDNDHNDDNGNGYNDDNHDNDHQKGGDSGGAENRNFLGNVIKKRGKRSVGYGFKVKKQILNKPHELIIVLVITISKLKISLSLLHIITVRLSFFLPVGKSACRGQFFPPHFGGMIFE